MDASDRAPLDLSAPDLSAPDLSAPDLSAPDPSAPDPSALGHHGDVEAYPGLLDFAADVRGARPLQTVRNRLANRTQGGRGAHVGADDEGGLQ